MPNYGHKRVRQFLYCIIMGWIFRYVVYMFVHTFLTVYESAAVLISLCVDEYAAILPPLALNTLHLI